MSPTTAETESGPSWRAVGVWVALYAAASVLFVAPFLPLGELASTPGWGDPRLIAWTLAWHTRWPLTGESPLAAPFFAPDPAALVYSEPLIGLGLLAAPLTAAAGPVVAFNALRLVIPVTNALAMAWLIWHYLRDERAAFVSGFALGLAYSQIAMVFMGLIHLAVLSGFVLSARSLDRWWRSGALADLALATAFACVQALVSWYAAVIALVMLVVQAAWLLATDVGSVGAARRRIAHLGAAALVAGAVLWPLARPFLGTPVPSREELRTFSLAVRDYLRPPHDTWLGAAITGVTGGPWEERRSYFVGAAAGVSALVGIVVAAGGGPGRRVLWAVPLGIVGLLLSLGPSPVGGAWRPFDLVSVVPGLSGFRVPGRMAVLVAIAIAMLVGPAVLAVPRRRRSLAAIVLVGLFVGEGYMAHYQRPPSGPLQRPPIFDAVAADRPENVLILPMLGRTPQWPSEADYQLFAMPSWTSIVNGYGRRVPSTYEAVLEAVAAYPESSLAEVLRFYGVSHIVVLGAYADGGAAFKAAADASADFEPVVTDGSDALYRVRPAPVGR